MAAKRAWTVTGVNDGRRWIARMEKAGMDGEAGSPAARSISLIVEWENAARIGSERAERTIAALAGQIAALRPAFGGAAEIVFVHDGSPGAEASIEATIRAAAPGLAVPWRSAASADPSYAGQKWRGAGLAKGDVLVFLDSDVVPQPGWLEGLVLPFARPETEIVCGATFVDPSDFYSAAMALGWLFPLRGTATGLVEVDWMQANNFAIRRDIFLALPPPSSEGYRDGTVRLIEALRQRGHRILLEQGAAVDHPPPAGPRHFALRGLWSGYDNALRYRRRRARWRGSAVMLSDLLHAWLRIGRNYRRVGLGPGRAVGAAALISVYYALRIGGYAAGLAAPRFTERRLRAADS